MNDTILPGFSELSYAASCRRFARYFQQMGDVNSARVHKSAAADFIFLSRKERERAEALNELRAMANDYQVPPDGGLTSTAQLDGEGHLQTANSATQEDCPSVNGRGQPSHFFGEAA